jgi:hypothetical protein
MPNRPLSAKLHSLRSASQNLASTDEPPEGAAAVVALKRIIENRIAALEILQAASEAARAEDLLRQKGFSHPLIASTLMDSHR